MARRRSRRAAPRRMSYRRRSHRHGHKGLIAQATSAVKKVGYGMARVSGPLMVGAGGGLIALSVVDRAVVGAKSRNLGSIKAELQGAGSDVAAVAVPAAILIGGGIITTKIIGAALKG